MLSCGDTGRKSVPRDHLTLLPFDIKQAANNHLITRLWPLTLFHKKEKKIHIYRPSSTTQIWFIKRWWLCKERERVMDERFWKLYCVSQEERRPSSPPAECGGQRACCAGLWWPKLVVGSVSSCLTHQHTQAHLDNTLTLYLGTAEPQVPRPTVSSAPVSLSASGTRGSSRWDA